MADFRTRLITLAGAATMFAGMAFSQVSVTSTSLNGVIPGYIRAEGTTELLPSLVVPLTGAVGATSPVNLTVIVAPNVTLDSLSNSSGVSEITATANGGGTSVNATVNGNQLLFTGISVTTTTTTITVANIRVNASQLASSQFTPITEQVFISGVGATPSSTSAQAVAYAFNGLATTTVTNTTTNNSACSSVSASTVQYTVAVSEGFVGAFKTQAGETGGITANNGTRIAVTLGNIPANVNVYVPLTVAGSGTGVLTSIASATAKTAGSNNSAAAGTSAPLSGYAAVTISNGTGTAYYELTTAVNATLESFGIPVYYSANPGAVSANTGNATVSVSFAPTGATTAPNFVVGSSTSTISKNTSSWSVCSTTLLFPFVTNQLGFDTGLAISNTSTDSLGLTSKGAVTSSASPQSGTCTLNFYGSSAPAAFTTPAVVATGTSWTSAASVVAPGFQGYTIAVCNFQFAHGFAFVTYNLTQNNGAAMGYLAEVIADRPTGGATPGTAEQLEN